MEIKQPDSAGFEQYRERYERSITDPEGFWDEEAKKELHWFRPYSTVFQGSFEEGDIAWFLEGQLNVCYNCVDRHAISKPDQTAILWEGDDGENRHISYLELQRGVCRIANALLSKGVAKGDVVTIYLPMIPELAMTMLACARIGAVHSVVFAGFSAEALRGRIEDGASRFVVTSNEGKRGGRTLPLHDITLQACEDLSVVESIFVFHRTEAEEAEDPRNVHMEELLTLQRPYCPCATLDAEDTLFILYTSGSTGKPKGVAHSSAGYLLYTIMTTKHSFDLREGDVFACVADCGWITGHSYIVYGPLGNGATTLMFESTPMYPDHGRYWDLVQKHRVTQFYTAPTAIRALMKFGEDVFEQFDLSSLRVLGTVGEPINPEAWHWYHTHVGKGDCFIVDTWWQTETGGHMLTPLPGKTPMRAGSCSLPQYGVQPVVLDPATGQELEGNGVEGVLAIKHPWPSLARTVYGNHDRYLKVYMQPYPGYYFTGDGCRRDEEGFFWITGRVDDVLTTSGHRIGTAEIESAVVSHSHASEAAVVGFPHDVKGEGIFVYVILCEGCEESEALLREMRGAVREGIGPFASPDRIVVVPGLPKTRSGKIMRRILRKIAANETEQIGDVSTLADPEVVQKIIDKVEQTA